MAKVPATVGREWTGFLTAACRRAVPFTVVRSSLPHTKNGGAIMAVNDWLRGTVLVTLLVFCLATAALVAEPGADMGEDDRAHSAGRWRIVTAAINGREVDRDITSLLSVTYAPDGRWGVLFKNIPVAEGTSVIDATSEPRSFRMDTRGGTGSPARAYRGIYELRGDSRRICFVPAGAPVPTEFSSPRGDGHILVEFARLEAR